MATWHCAQVNVAWKPVSCQPPPYSAWLNVIPVTVQSLLVWHESQVWGNPAAEWGGLVVLPQSLLGGPT